MKLVILSDTHGNYPLAIRAIESAGNIDGIIHLGDEIDDARMIETVLERKVVMIPGNCDLLATEPRDLIATYEGVRILMTHGDRYGVKAGLATLQKKAAESSVRVVLYGHSHRAHHVQVGGVLFINPGCLNYNCRTNSFATLSIENGLICAKLIPIGQ